MATRVNNLIEFMQAGETLAANDAVYVDSSDGKIYKLDVTDDTKNKYFGIVKDAGVLNDWLRVVQSGKARGFSGLTPGQPVYASTTVAGGFQLTEPSPNQSITLGTAKSATELIINAALSAKTGGAGSGLETGELIANAGFEEDDLSNVSCTNATVTRVASVTGGANNEWALQITATAPTWFCDITGAGSEGTGFAKLQAKATIGADAEFCVLANGVEQVCHQSNILTSKSETFSIPTVLDGTKNSIRIKGTSASNVVTADKASFKTGLLTTTGYYREEIITLVDSGTNDINGIMRVVRDGNIVTISGRTFFTHTSADAPISAAGVLPIWARPNEPQSNTYNASTFERRDFRVFVDGSIGFTYSASTTNSGRAPQITYAVAEAQTVRSFNSMVYSSDLDAYEESFVSITTTPSTIQFSDAIVTNGSFSSGVFTFGQSGYYEAVVSGRMSRTNVNSANINATFTYRINGVDEIRVCSSYVRYDDTDLPRAALSMPGNSLYCPLKGFFNKGDTLSITGVTDTASVTLSYRRFSITSYANPNGEPVSAVVSTEYVSGGVEKPTGDFWDGAPIYRRCYEIVSDTTGATIDTIQSGLKILDSQKYTTERWLIAQASFEQQGDSNALIYYNETTGGIMTTINGRTIYAGTNFCMRYVKP